MSTKDGGRSTHVRNGYRPNHFFDDWVFMGPIRLEDPLYPGESRKVNVAFIDVKELREKLIVGQEWRIQEGGHIVGKGIITNIGTLID
ncbi:MAG: hypothetical protein H7Z73_03950 [Candidatus Saccharibacteria bacterium]|nr:hypothetical protein [Moraxellaceae bacterium]